MSTHLTRPEPVDAWKWGVDDTTAVAFPADRFRLNSTGSTWELRTHLGNWHPVRPGDWIAHNLITDSWGLYRGDDTHGFSTGHIDRADAIRRIVAVWRNLTGNTRTVEEMAELMLAALEGAGHTVLVER